MVDGIVRLLRLGWWLRLRLREVGPRSATVLDPWIVFRVDGAAFPLSPWGDTVEYVTHLVIRVDPPFDFPQIVMDKPRDWLNNLQGVGLIVRADVRVIRSLVWLRRGWGRCSSHGGWQWSVGKSRGG